jgi:hypothetical protein
VKKGIRVTVEDLETGESEVQEIEDDYVIVTGGSCYVDGLVAYSNGTHVLTIKGRSAAQGESS